jgi:hypothetical protein
VTVAPAMDTQREAATQLALANRAGFDLATVSDEDFEQGLARIATRQKRMARILETVLVEEVHYGNPKTRDGREVFPKPILYQAGAEELRNLFRLRLRHVEAPRIIETAEYVSVTVMVAIEDTAGRLSAPRSGNCNTMEKRFERRDGKGFTYKDAREKVHECLAMAEKRAGALATKEITGANAFFASQDEDAMRQHLAEAETDEPITEEQRQKLYADCRAAGIKTKEQLADFVKDTIGEGEIGQKDLDKLNEALERRRGKKAVPEAKLGEQQELGDAAE